MAQNSVVEYPLSSIFLGLRSLHCVWSSHWRRKPLNRYSDKALRIGFKISVRKRIIGKIRPHNLFEQTETQTEICWPDKKSRQWEMHAVLRCRNELWMCVWSCMVRLEVKVTVSKATLWSILAAMARWKLRQDNSPGPQSLRSAWAAYKDSV